MNKQQTVECLKLLLDSVILKDGNPKFTILNDVKPSSFEFVLYEAIYHLESANK